MTPCSCITCIYCSYRALEPNCLIPTKPCGLHSESISTSSWLDSSSDRGYSSIAELSIICCLTILAVAAWHARIVPPTCFTLHSFINHATCYDVD